MGLKKSQHLRKLIFAGTLICFLSFSGCATLGIATSGIFQLLNTALVLPFKIASKVIDFAKTLPMPPPGVF